MGLKSIYILCIAFYNGQLVLDDEMFKNFFDIFYIYQINFECNFSLVMYISDFELIV